MNDSIFESDTNPGRGDSDIVRNVQDDAALLHVYQAGPVTVVGFNGQDVPPDHCLSSYRKQLTALIEEHDCKNLAFDMDGVKMVPSGLLGLITSFSRHGVEVSIFNASEDIRDVLAVTKLDQLINVREVSL